MKKCIFLILVCISCNTAKHHKSVAVTTKDSVVHSATQQGSISTSNSTLKQLTFNNNNRIFHVNFLSDTSKKQHNSIRIKDSADALIVDAGDNIIQSLDYQNLKQEEKHTDSTGNKRDSSFNNNQQDTQVKDTQKNVITDTSTSRVPWYLIVIIFVVAAIIFLTIFKAGKDRIA